MFNPLLPNPGSHRAYANGCTCDLLRNQFGKGSDTSGLSLVWEVSTDCEMHTKTAAILQAAQLKKELASYANRTDDG